LYNRPDIIILNKQQKQAYLLDIAAPNSHNITQTYNTKINKYLELSVAMRKFNLLKNTQPHYSYTPESCLENDNYKLYCITDQTLLS
jgi:hypothetical protein